MNFQFHDYHPEFEDLHHALIHGFSQSPKRLSPKFFYDAAGSQIFDQICAQPEYYVPAVERRIFEMHADDIIACIGDDCHLIEPGAGSSVKVRFLLDRLRPAMYVPMDISSEHLRLSAERLAQDYPHIPIHAVCVDHTKPYELPPDIPSNRRVFFYPGSSLGNFDPHEAVAFLSDLRQKAGDGGGLLIGIDTKKPVHVLNQAYNDAAGVTAEFNLNLLKRVKRELGGDVDPDNFYHYAYYNSQHGRIEMHLVSRDDHTLRVNGNVFNFKAGESIHTENSYKYLPEEFQELARQADWQSVKLWQDEQKYFSLHYLKTA